MSHTPFATDNPYRVYDLDLPLRIPGFGVRFAISKFKQIGVWSKLSPALRAKAKHARGTWSALKLTQRDLDSVSDDVWVIIAREWSVRWTYAAARCSSSPSTALPDHDSALDVASNLFQTPQSLHETRKLRRPALDELPPSFLRPDQGMP
jgi:hypothetical protein